MNKLSEEERARLTRQMAEERAVKKYVPPRHDCLGIHKKLINDNRKDLMEV